MIKNIYESNKIFNQIILSNLNPYSYYKLMQFDHFFNFVISFQQKLIHSARQSL
jgi:hypothetical protein